LLKFLLLAATDLAFFDFVPADEALQEQDPFLPLSNPGLFGIGAACLMTGHPVD
jgi:hypothetical protein